MKSLEEEVPQRNTDRNNSLKLNLAKVFFATALLGASSFVANAQDFPNGYSNQQSNLQANNLTDQSLIEAIAPYEEDVRNDILIATQYPDVLQQLGQIRDNTSKIFQQTIQDYPQKKQNWFYEVSRYPDLLDKLGSLPKHQSQDQIEALVSNPSPESKEAAWKLYSKHHDDLVKVNNLNQQALRSFNDLINPLSRNAQNAFKTLQEMPDVLSLLNDHLDLSTRIGERFRNDPSAVSQEIADVHDQLDTKNKQDLASYKEELAQNPQALDELNQASKDYASTGGYSYPAPTGDKVVNYGNPYSYWFGYPSWYNSPMWYPGMYGYGSGIYFGLGGYPSIYGFPSLGFSRWFFGGAYRYYPNLYRQYGRYYRDSYARGGGYMSANRRAFMGTANRHFVPNMSARSGGFNNNQAYRQGGNLRSYNAPSRSYNMAPRSYSLGRSSAPSYGRPSFGGGSRGFGGGGYSGGFHGGGGSRGGRH